MKKIILAIIVLFISQINSGAQSIISKEIYVKSKRCLKIPDIFNHERPRIGPFYNVQIGSRIYGHASNFPANNNPIGNFDGTLIIMDLNFDTIKTVSYGGTGEDNINFINLLPNGNLLLSGNTTSIDGDVWYGIDSSSPQIWLQEVDTNGTIIKGMTFGGSGGSGFSNIPSISEDGYIYMAGGTLAKDGDFAHTSPYSQFFDTDPWMAKIDSNLNIVWIKTMTTAENDSYSNIIQINKNLIFLLMSVRETNTSPDFLFNNSKGGADHLVFAIDSNGIILWKKRYGGSFNDGLNKVYYDSINHVCYLGGGTRSYDKDIKYRTGTLYPPNSTYPINGIWLMKIDTLGNILESKAYGGLTSGIYNNQQSGFTFNDGKMWAFCTYLVGNGDFYTNTFPQNDTIKNAWLGQFDSNLNLIGKYVAICNVNITFLSFIDVDEKFYALGGSSVNFGSTIINKYSCDTMDEFHFLLEIGDAPLTSKSIEDKTKPQFEIFPNPSENSVNVFVKSRKNSEILSLEVFTNDGRKVESLKIKEKITLDCSKWASGIYYFKISNTDNSETKPFFKQ